MAHTIRVRPEYTAIAAKHGAANCAQIARLIGVDRSTVIRVLNGATTPGPTFMAKSVTALGTGFDALFEADRSAA